MRYLLITLISLLAAAAFARDLPPDGRQANLGAIEYPFVQLAGKPARLSPGARIFDENGRIVLPNTFSGQVPVLYKLDIRGDVQEIWVLTADEVAALRNRKKAQ